MMHPDIHDSEKKRPAPNLLRLIRGFLYGGTAAFLLGALIWGVVLLQQGNAVPAAQAGQAVAEIPQPGIPLAPPDTTTASTAGEEQDASEDGGDVTVECTLSIPSLSLDLPVLAYCTDEALLSSVCKFSGPQPGQPGNYVIAGHNFISGAQFAKLDEMQKGDEVILTDKDERVFAYRVYALELVTPENIHALAAEPDSTQVTLMTCARENTMRLLVRCRMQ